MDDVTHGPSQFDQGYRLARAELEEMPVHVYFWDLGDAIEKQVRISLGEAEDLQKDGYPGASLVRSITAIELVIRDFLLMPLVKNAFLSDEWADLLLGRVLDRRATGRDRELVPAVLRQWDVDVTELTTSDGKQLWERIQRLVAARNRYVHEGHPVNPEHAPEAIDCAQRLLTEAVFPVAMEVGVRRPEWGCWQAGPAPV